MEESKTQMERILGKESKGIWGTQIERKGIIELFLWEYKKNPEPRRKGRLR
jgi:hypothetical protein